jgi:hypothetical protein
MPQEYSQKTGRKKRQSGGNRAFSGRFVRFGLLKQTIIHTGQIFNYLLKINST